MRYKPTAVPTNIPRGAREWLANELRRIANAFADPVVDIVTLDPLAAEPERRRDGMIVYANGTDWNPGGGAGVYARESGAWVKL